MDIQQKHKVLIGGLGSEATQIAEYLKLWGFEVKQVEHNPLAIQFEVLQFKPRAMIISAKTRYPGQLCENLKKVEKHLYIIIVSGLNGLFVPTDVLNFVDKVVTSPYNLDEIKNDLTSLSDGAEDEAVTELPAETEDEFPCLYEPLTVHFEITDYLKMLCLTPNYSGYEYIREAIKIALSGERLTKGMSKIIYPSIAKRHKVSSASVERSMRTAIQRAWSKVKPEDKAELFGHFALKQDWTPTNSELVFIIADKISCSLSNRALKKA